MMTLSRSSRKDFTMRRACLLALATLTIAACQTGTTVMPTASSQPPVDVLPAFANTIWPAIAGYNLHKSQGGPESKQFHDVMDPSIKNGGADTIDAYSALREAAQNLGHKGYDRTTNTHHYNDGITAAHTDIQSASDNTATLNVCYTYTHYWYVNTADAQHAPGASEATVELVNIDNMWHLHAITNDHVVPSCSAGSD